VVAKGFTQVPGIDFNETYALVTCLESICAILHIGATKDWDIDHLDVKTTFLHGELDKEIYMEQPEGAKEPGKEDWVCCLNKSLYGLCQASQQWSKKLHNCLTKEGFTCCAAEHSIFTRTNDLGTAIIAVHVDDMPVTASSPSAMSSAKAALRKYFNIVDLGPVKWLLGICIERNRPNRTIALSQTAYIDTIVTRFKLQDSFKVGTPMDTSVIL